MNQLNAFPANGLCQPELGADRLVTVKAGCWVLRDWNVESTDLVKERAGPAEASDLDVKTGIDLTLWLHGRIGVRFRQPQTR